MCKVMATAITRSEAEKKINQWMEDMFGTGKERRSACGRQTEKYIHTMVEDGTFALDEILDQAGAYFEGYNDGAK